MQPVIAMKERLQLTSSCIFTRVTASRRVSWSHVVDEVVVVCVCVCVRFSAFLWHHINASQMPFPKAISAINGEKNHCNF